MNSREKKRSVRTGLAPVLIVSMLMAGCVSTPADPSIMTPAEIALRQQNAEDMRIVQGVGTGALIGAASGALISAIAGGDGKAIARGALVGGLVGGVAGGVDANNVNRGARSQAARQDRFRETIKSADRAIANYRRTNSLAASLVASENRRVANLNSDFRAGRIDRAAYRSQMANARSNVAALDTQISRAERDISDLRSAGRDGAPVSGKIAALEATKSDLQRQRNSLRSSYRRVPGEINLDI